MKSLVVSAALAAFLITTAAPAMAQDFSITNEPVDTGRRSLTRQLQAWWETHAYYPRHASNADEGGTVKVHLLIHTDGVIWMSNVVESSGSRSLDAAGVSAFRDGFIRPFPAGVPEVELDLTLHYVLAYRHDQPVAAGFTAGSRRAFTITNEPVESPILSTMLQKNCVGAVVKQGIRNRPWYGTRYEAQAVFFRRPDGTPWVRFFEGGSSPSFAPVVEVGKMLRWSGPEEHLGSGTSSFTQYTAWSDKDGTIAGNIETIYLASARSNMPINRGGTVDFSCSDQTVPAVTVNALFVTPGQRPPGDPP